MRRSSKLLSNINGYSLDINQRKAVICDNKSSLIIAGAGSGKSLTMVAKIRYLIEMKNISEDDILCISFTNDACINLENNIKKNYNYNIKVYTFHKLALSFLRGKKYNIISDNYLNYIVDEYFQSFILTNKSLINGLKAYLNKIDYSYNYILKSNDLIILKKLIITFINLFKTNNHKLSDFLNIRNDRILIRIIIDIYLLYESELRSTNSIDFNDMLLLATDFVRTNNIKKYKYIIVDEYQDTSYIRYLFLKEIIKNTGAKITCVGDDYQSIYRFNGCDLNMFLDFKKYFGKFKLLKIVNTYRNSQELINVAGGFIMKNKRQLYKKLKSDKRLCKPIKIVYKKSLDELLDIIIKKYDSILILGRNNFDIKKYSNMFTSNNIMYKNKKVKYLTVHSSKGLEDECVILINLTDDILGFPNKIKDNKILSYVSLGVNNYPYDEERRLFYVALTRTKNEVYLLVDKKNQSIFVKELIKDYSKYIEYI